MHARFSHRVWRKERTNIQTSYAKKRWPWSCIFDLDRHLMMTIYNSWRMPTVRSCSRICPILSWNSVNPMPLHHHAIYGDVDSRGFNLAWQKIWVGAEARGENEWKPSSDRGESTSLSSFCRTSKESRAQVQLLCWSCCCCKLPKAFTQFSEV